MGDSPESELKRKEQAQLKSPTESALHKDPPDLSPSEARSVRLSTQKVRLVLFVFIGTGLLVFPWVTQLGMLNAAIKALIAVLFALSFNLLMGQAGLLSFGQ